MKKIIAGGPLLIRKLGIEHQIAFVERILLKRANPARPSPTPAESSVGPPNNFVGGECVAPLQNNNQQTILNEFR